MKPAAVRPVDELLWQPAPRAGVLLPLPLSGAYDYKLPKGTLVSRGLLVSAPIGPREQLGVVWGKAEGTVGDNRLKEAVPLEGSPDKVAVHAVCRENVFWETLESLKKAGASALLVLPVEKMLV